MLDNDIMNDNVQTNDINDIIDNNINILLNKEENNMKDTLVLSGGSIKGVAQIGALQCLKDNKYLVNIKNVAGTSAGSMVGMLYCIGYDPLELFRFMKLLDLKKTRKLDPTNIITKYGLDNGDRLILVLEKLLIAKNFPKDITFEQFYKKTQINFIVTGTCVNDKKVCYFSHVEYPNMKVLEAIRISISVPIIFTPHMYENKLYVDGGCIDNYPLQLFSKKIHKVIGIYVSEKMENDVNIKYIEQYFIAIMKCMIEGMTRNDIKIYDQCTVNIKCGYYNEQIEDLIALYDEGYNTTQKKINSGDLG